MEFAALRGASFVSGKFLQLIWRPKYTSLRPGGKMVEFQPMPHDHTLRIYLQFDLLFVADLRGLLADLEKAFNILEAAELGRRRVRRDDRLIVSVLRTGQSLTMLLAGGAGLVALANIVKKLAEARETAWKSEESKWKAKTAKLDHQKRKSEAESQRSRDLSAEEIAKEVLGSRIEKIEAATHVTSIEIDVDGESAKIVFEDTLRKESRRALTIRAVEDVRGQEAKKRLPPPTDTKKER